MIHGKRSGQFFGPDPPLQQEQTGHEINQH